MHIICRGDFISLKNIAEVNTSALIKNVKNIRKAVGDSVKICAVVKADAYGHGGSGVAVRIERFIDCFAVTLLEEGIELRLSGVSAPVLLLIPIESLEDIERALRYSLTLTVQSVELLSKINRIAKKLSVIAPVHLKINTGMNRFGFDLPYLKQACARIKNLRNIKICGCYTHFYNSTNKTDCDKQFNLFLQAKDLVGKYFDGVIYHISASGGILQDRKYDLDMVRPGLLIYGYKPFESKAVAVKPILKVKSAVLCNRQIKKGEHLLYGNYREVNDKDVSIVRCGYADGFRRSDGLLNYRCMDVSACDLTRKKNVIVFDNADFVASAEGTIPYEVLTLITKRANIVYKD